MKVIATKNKKTKAILLTVIMIIILPISIIPVSLDIIGSENKREIPILMYHSMLKSKQYIGQYVVSPDEFESDLNYLEENGYTAIFMQDLIDCVKGNGSLPAKPVVITFDDGYYNNYYYAYKIAKEHNIKMVISIIVSQTDLYSENHDENPNYSHLTWDEINEMLNSGIVEIANHSYDLHAQNGKYIGVTKSKCESDEEYEQRLTNDIKKAQDKIFEKTGRMPTTFTYPFGLADKKTKEIIKNLGFDATLLVENKKASVEIGNDSSLYNLKRCIRVGGASTYKVMKKYKI